MYFLMLVPSYFEKLMYILRQSPIFLLLTKTSFTYVMQIWQLFIILRQHVTISVTVFSNLTKLTNDLFFSPI